MLAAVAVLMPVAPAAAIRSGEPDTERASARRVNNPVLDPSIADERLSAKPYADPRFAYNQRGGNLPVLGRH